MQEVIQKYRKLTYYQTKRCSLCFSALLSACCDLRFLCLPQRQSFFSSWTQNFKRHKLSFVPYIVSFFGLKTAFSKLSLAKYHYLHKKLYVISCIQLLLQKSLQIFFSFINSPVEIFIDWKAVVHETICIIWFVWLLLVLKSLHTNLKR